MTKIVLASSSPYRKKLLQRLGIPFIGLAPDVDETPRPGEPARELVARLSRRKAETIAHTLDSQSVVIGSDQVAELDEQILTKPGDHAGARNQLTACSGKRVLFHTGLCVITPSGEALESITTTLVDFRTLSSAQIERYLQLEKPYDCAGSFKCEGLGIALFTRLSCDDPTALEGLPLIQLCTHLEKLNLGPLN